jgi:hypothetical protein
MIMQVRLKETYIDASGNLVQPDTPVFAFGTHPLATDAEAHPVNAARSEDNKLRIIVDELLVGNYLEEINCRGQVDDDSYDTVPLGATPDDIAKCAVPKDVLPGSCKGDHVVCMCKLDGGCGDVMKGEPVGVKDVNQDGAADEHRMIAGAVGLKCDDVDVPINPFLSYWNPSGDQQVPAMGGFDALGPAIVLQPDPIPGAGVDIAFLPTNTTCSLTFSPDIVDKQGNQLCTPPDGDIKKNCTPGDVSAFSFKVQPLGFKSGGQTVFDGDTGQPTTGSYTFGFTAPLAATAAASITVTEGTTPFTDFTVTQPLPESVRITWSAAGLKPNQDYTITFGAGFADLYNKPLPAPISITFKTAP